MRTLTLPILLLPLFVANGSSLPAQTSAPTLQQRPADQVPTLRAQAKLVVVDVVVTDKDHHPIHGLKQSQFTLLEDKTSQTISSFEEHAPHTAAEIARFPSMPPLPPGVFTNFVPAPLNSAVNILLLDTLNTPLKDQQFVRQQVLNYLKNAKPGTNIAIFGLTTRLIMLQGFTSDPELLKAVVGKQSGKASVALDDVVGGGGLPDTVADQNLINGNPMPADVAASLQTFNNIVQSFQLQLRAKYTLDAMSILARYLSSIPGRKNLIWFSGSFPLDIDPDITGESSDPFAAMADSEDEYRDTTNLLARAQVAVYPIDARGLMTQPMFDASSSGAKYAANPRAFSRDLNTFNSNTVNEHSTMYRMAEDTGGRAFVNTNGLTQAVQSAIDEGSSYYTITYSPSNPNWKGNFRRIAVTLSAPGYQLAYRHGYYADDPNSPHSAVLLSPGAPAKAGTLAGTPAPDPSTVQKAMVHGVPGPTQILYKVRILPIGTTTEDAPAPGNVNGKPGFAAAKPPFRRYAVDFAAIPSDISWEAHKDGSRHGAIEFVTFVYNPDGELINSQINDIEGNVSAERFAALQRAGIPMHQEISVPVKGDFSIRTGIVDRLNGHIGAAEVSVAALKNLPPLPSQPAPAPSQPSPAQPAPASSAPSTTPPSH